MLFQRGPERTVPEGVSVLKFSCLTKLGSNSRQREHRDIASVGAMSVQANSAKHVELTDADPAVVQTLQEAVLLNDSCAAARPETKERCERRCINNVQTAARTCRPSLFKHWVWVQNRYPKWNPGKWTEGPPTHFTTPANF